MSNGSDDGDDIVKLSGVAGIPGQGPHMIILLRVQSDYGIINSARFSAYKCPAAQACGQWVTEALEGKTLDEAAALAEQDILAGVGTMPLGREHCPTLAIDALRNALAQSEVGNNTAKISQT